MIFFEKIILKKIVQRRIKFGENRTRDITKENHSVKDSTELDRKILQRKMLQRKIDQNGKASGG